MRGYVARGFFVLAYEHLGPLVLVSMARSLPWLALALLITFLPLDGTPAATILFSTGGLLLLALLLAPFSSGAAHRLSARMARGEEPELRACFRSAGQGYLPRLGWTLGQAVLAFLALYNTWTYFGMESSQRSFPMLLALGAGLWLWILARFWSFCWLPLQSSRGRGAREAAQVALLLVLTDPRRLLSHFLLRQTLALLMLISGLGLFLGLGGLLPLQSALVLRESLRPHGLDLTGPNEAQRNEPLELPDRLPRLWRPWS